MQRINCTTDSRRCHYPFVTSPELWSAGAGDKHPLSRSESQKFTPKTWFLFSTTCLLSPPVTQGFRRTKHWDMRRVLESNWLRLDEVSVKHPEERTATHQRLSNVLTREINKITERSLFVLSDRSSETSENKWIFQHENLTIRGRNNERFLLISQSCVDF